MVKVKTYIISGEIRKKYANIPFSKEIIDVKKENVLEKIYAELGSRHKAKRFEIKIIKFEEKE